MSIGKNNAKKRWPCASAFLDRSFQAIALTQKGCGHVLKIMYFQALK